MALPAGVLLRHPSGTDEDAVLVLVLSTACQVADTGRSDRELADVIEDWQRPGVDPAKDVWIAQDGGGEALGYAFVAPPYAEVRVHPRARGRGLGAHLRELVEARGAELGAGELRQVVAAGNRPAERQLEAAGYRPVFRSWRMERPLDVAPVAPRWPGGIAEDRIDDEHSVAEVLALLERSAATGPDGEPLALDRFHAEHLSDERLEPDLCVLARRGERLVGAAICETWDDVDGTIVQLAVDPAERFAEVGSALLLAAFARMRERGLEIAVVQIGGPGPDAPAPYEAVGLRSAWQQTTWRKPLG